MASPKKTEFLMLRVTENQLRQLDLLVSRRSSGFHQETRSQVVRDGIDRMYQEYEEERRKG